MNLAIHGKACTGKSTTANILRDRHGYAKVALAEPIYASVNISRAYLTTEDSLAFNMQEFLLGLTDVDTAMQVYVEWVPLIAKHRDVLLAVGKPRKFMQDFGLMFRSYDEDVFLRTALESAEGNSVVDDLRMQNEVWGFRDAGWMLVKVECPDEVRLERVRKLYPDQMNLLSHQTECELDEFSDWDAVISSDCPKEAMPERVNDLLAELRLLDR